MSSGFDPLESEIRVNDLLVRLRAALDRMRDAGEALFRLQQQARDRYSRNGPDQSAPGYASSTGSDRLSAAHGVYGACAYEVSQVRDSLRKESLKAQDHLEKQEANRRQLQQQGRGLLIQAGNRFREGARAAERDVQKCKDLLARIQSALEMEPKGGGADREWAAGFRTGGIEEVVRDTPSRRPAHSDQYPYRACDYRAETLARIDAITYATGAPYQSLRYLIPHLGSSGSARGNTLKEKIDLSCQAVTPPGANPYWCELPVGYQKILNPGDHGLLTSGRYDAGLSGSGDPASQYGTRSLLHLF